MDNKDLENIEFEEEASNDVASKNLIGVSDEINPLEIDFEFEDSKKTSSADSNDIKKDESLTESSSASDGYELDLELDLSSDSLIENALKEVEEKADGVVKEAKELVLENKASKEEDLVEQKIKKDNEDSELEFSFELEEDEGKVEEASDESLKEKKDQINLVQDKPEETSTISSKLSFELEGLPHEDEKVTDDVKVGLNQKEELDKSEEVSFSLEEAKEEVLESKDNKVDIKETPKVEEGVEEKKEIDKFKEKSVCQTNVNDQFDSVDFSEDSIEEVNLDLAPKKKIPIDILIWIVGGAVVLFVANYYLFSSTKNEVKKTSPVFSKILKEVKEVKKPVVVAKNVKIITYERELEDKFGKYNFNLSFKNNLLNTMSFELSFNEPAELTDQEIVEGLKARPWIRKITVEKISFVQNNTGDVVGIGKAKGYVVYDNKQKRTIIDVKLSGKSSNQNADLLLSLANDNSYFLKKKNGLNIEVDDNDEVKYQFIKNLKFTM